MTRLWFLAVLTCVVVVACERVPLTSPTGSTISVTIDQPTMPLNGQARVRAIVTESSGTPVHNGTQVNFTSSLGTFSPSEVETSGGVAITTFLSGSTSGTTRINAYSGGASTGTNSSGGGIEVKIGAAAAGSLTLSATPPSVSQSGGTVTISATVFDPNSNPLPGVNVNFSSSTGALSATTALTDANGVARTQLATTSTATVTATAGSATRDVTITAATAPTIDISAPTPASPTAGEPVSFNVTVSSGGSGNNTPRQVQTLDVNFGDGTRETRSNVTGSVGFTHIYRNPGGYTITATATDVANNTGVSSRAVVVGFPSQPTITAFTANPNPVPASANGLTNITVTAAGGSGTGAPPLRNVTVRNMTSGGEVIYSGTGGGTFAHRFGGTGTYTLQASATDANGNTGTSTTVVVVQ